MTRNFFRQLKADKVHYLLISGQAAVLYGAATFSEDLDIWLCPQNANRQRFIKALRTLRARYYKLTPPLTMAYLCKGHGFHFTLPAGDGTDWYLDVMGVPPRSPAFNVARRRSIRMKTPWGMVPVVSVPDLVELKKTQRLEDYAVISRLVLAMMSLLQNSTIRRPRQSVALQKPRQMAIFTMEGRAPSRPSEVLQEALMNRSYMKPSRRLARWAVQNIFSLAILTELIQRQPWVMTVTGHGMASLRTFGSKIVKGEEPGQILERRIEREMMGRMTTFQAADRLYWRRIIAELKSLRARGRLMPEGGRV